MTIPYCPDSLATARTRLHISLLCALAGPALAPVDAQAQNNSAPRSSSSLANSSDENDSLTLPSITVTGQSTSLSTEGTGEYTIKRTTAGTGLSLAPRETPQSVTVITRQRMDDQKLNSIRDVLENTTGVSSTMLDSERVNYYSRGFSIDSFMYDGVPTTPGGDFGPGEGVLDTSFYDRIEVVRGAAGLQQGVGDPSASVNLVRKRPLREFSVTGSFDLGRWDNYRGMLDFSTPLTSDGRVRARVVGTYQDRRSFQDYYQQQRQAFYGVVDVDLTLDTTLTVGHEYQNNEPEGVTWGGLPLFFSDGSRTDWSRSKNPAARWNQWKSEVNTTFARLEQRFDSGWTVRANADRKEVDVSSDMLSVNGYPDRSTGMGWQPMTLNGGVESQQNSFDLMASGPFQFLGREHELVLGGSSSRFKSYSDYSLNFTPTGMPGSFYSWDGSFPRQEFLPRSTTSTTIKQAGFYGAARFSLSDPLKLILGARISNYELDGSAGSNYKKSNQISPYAGVIYDLNETYSVYASYTEIFKPQPMFRDRNNNVLAPTEGNNKEIGIKGEYLDGRLNASLSVFEARLDGVAQLDEGQILPDGSQAYRAANGTKSRGFDMDVQGELKHGWNFYAGISHFTASDGQGNRLNSQIPRTTARLFTTYRLPGDWNKLTIGGGVNWQSRFYQNAINPLRQSVEVGQSSYALASLMARYEVSNTTSISANITNLFDKKYYSAAGFQNGYLYGEPRSFMINLTYKME